MKNSITVSNISVAYSAKPVLEGISFDIREGEYVAIIGKSGTGKTTLLNALAGFIPYEGRIEIQGTIGFCFQSNSLFYWLTVEGNIGFGLGHLSKESRKARVAEILRVIDLENCAGKYPSQLSGGQVQRVALGRVIACNPAVLLLDEPFSSLDIYTRDQMIDWMLKIIAETRITTIMVTHYIDEALVLADRVFVLKDRESPLLQLKVPFDRPRTQQIRFTTEFQSQKQMLADRLNHV